MIWTERKTVFFKLEDLPFDEDHIELIDPTRLVIRISDEKMVVDLGALCYSKRKRKATATANPDYETWLVVLSSECAGRRRMVLGIAELLFIKQKMGGRVTSIDDLRSKFTQFVQWCDINYDTAFSTPESMLSSIDRYSEHLLERVKQSTLSVNSAADRQAVIADALSHLLQMPANEVLAGTRRIRRSNAARNHIEPPLRHETIEALAVLHEVFTRFSQHVLDNRAYPFMLSLPNEDVWVFPAHKMVATKESLSTRSQWKKPYWAYDYTNGRIFDCEEIAHRYQGTRDRGRGNARSAIARANSLLEEANTDMNHRYRRDLATLAAQSFLMLFLATTGMNLSSAIALRWGSGNYEISKTSGHFKTIKYRAKGRNVEFLVGSRFVKKFRTYLRLREWLLPEKHDRLFFRFDGKIPRPISKKFSQDLYVRLTRLFGPVAKVTARQWRAAKSDFLLRNFDIATAAVALQNTEETVIQSYATGSPSSAGEEMRDFFEHFQLSIAAAGDHVTRGIGVGQCRNYGEPSVNGHDAIWSPDCNTDEGCLFCANYLVQPNETDARKLLSLRYLIQQSRGLAFDKHHFSKIYASILNRIHAILAAIVSQVPEMRDAIDRIQKEVDEEERLSPYWSRKLALLIDLEVLA